MTLRQASLPMAGACAVLLLQACVEYLPENDPLQAGGPTVSADASPGAPPTPPPSAPVPGSVPPAPTPPPPQPPASSDEALVAPIALYPDPLISVLLPASTFPDQITAAANYLVQYGDPTQIANQPWDPSVRALAHYPAVVAWMAQNLPWTEALGYAFASAPAAVMDAVQALRARALAAGTLRTTPQQQVVSDDGGVDIVPAQPGVIYVPVYDPNVVFDEGGYYDYNGPFINFGDPCPVGVWLDFGFDWRRHEVWHGSPYYWRNGGYGPGRGRLPPGSRPWHPPAGGGATPPITTGTGPRVAPLPNPMPGAPNPPPPHYRVAQHAGAAAPAPGSGGSAPQPRPRLVPPATSPATGIVTPRSPAPLVGGEGVRAAPLALQPAAAGRYAPAPQPRSEAPSSYAPVASAPPAREVREAPERQAEPRATEARSEPAHESHAAAPAPQAAPAAQAPSQPSNAPPKQP